MHPPIKDPLIGTTVDDRFRILAGIGQGATSSVYKAEELSTGKTAAIKILHAHLCTNESLVARFEREAQAAKILVHPNIVAVNEYAVASNGTPYLVMDFVDGVSLQQNLIANESLSLAVALPLFIQVCAALNVAHQAGIIHRDLKPGNIMLTTQPDGTLLVKILDFGCAMVMPLLGDTVLKVTQTGEMLGSLLYMSPEQCLDQDVDARSDCYSLACVLYETLTGKPPLSARTAFETMNKQLSTMPESLARVRPDLVFPKQLEKIIFKAMAKSPAKRYQNIVDFMDALLNLSGEKTTVPRHQQPTIEKTQQISIKQFAPSKKNLQNVWKIYWPFVLIALTFLSETLNQQLLPLIAIIFAICLFKATVDEIQEVHNFEPAKKELQTFWKVYWPYVCLVLLYLSMTYNPILLPFVAIVFGIVLIKVVVDEQKVLTKNENETPVAAIASPSEKQELTNKLAQLAPLAKLDIIVHDARKAFTYQSGDALISMDVSTDGSTIQEIIVRPVFQRSFFWDSICEESKNTRESGQVFEMSAYITKSTDKNWNVLVIKANQATIVETVVPTSDETDPTTPL